MARPLVSDELWERIEPLIPERAPNPQGGRPPVPDRNALTGIIFVLKTGIPWEDLPQEMDCGSGMTCWRRLRDWQQAEVWDRLVALLLDELRDADKIDFSRAAVDSGTVRAVGGGEKTGPNPTDRRKPGSKHHLLTDANGIPLKTILTGANRHDVTQLLPLAWIIQRAFGSGDGRGKGCGKRDVWSTVGRGMANRPLTPGGVCNRRASADRVGRDVNRCRERLGTGRGFAG